MRPALLTRRRLAAAVLAGLAALASPGSARAAFVPTTVSIAGTPQTSGPGYFTGSVSVTSGTLNANGTSTATVVVSLTNTSPVANGGYITGFAFNLPGTISGATLSSTYTPNTGQSFGVIGGGTYNNTVRDYSNDLSGSPYGYFDIGAAVGNNLLGTGLPANGLATNSTGGEKGTFTFTLTSAKGGYNLANLTAQVLMSTLSANPQGGGAQPFLVRFRGFCDGSSDKVVGGVVCDNNPPPPSGVPAPPAVVLALAGFATCLMGRGFRRRLTARAE